MTTTLDLIAGTLTAPAALTLAPPMWIVQVRACHAPALIRQLIALGCHFGQLSWGQALDVLLVVFSPSPLRADVRAALEDDGRKVRGWDAHLDVDGEWEEYRPQERKST